MDFKYITRVTRESAGKNYTTFFYYAVDVILKHTNWTKKEQMAFFGEPQSA